MSSTIYNLNVVVNGEGGSVDVDLSSPIQLEEGATSTIIPTAQEGWQFDGWTVDPADTVYTIDPLTNAIEVTMGTADITLTANFSRVKHTVTIQVNNPLGGYTDPVGPLLLAEGEQIAITPYANADWLFDSWTIEPGDTGFSIDSATNLVTMGKTDVTLTANFVQPVSVSLFAASTPPTGGPTGDEDDESAGGDDESAGGDDESTGGDDGTAGGDDSTTGGDDSTTES